jgi:hypothetical protein
VEWSSAAAGDSRAPLPSGLTRRSRERIQRFPSTGWSLQQNTDLATTNWVTPAETINNDGTNKFIIVKPPTGNRYYRLKNP